MLSQAQNGPVNTCCTIFICCGFVISWFLSYFFDYKKDRNELHFYVALSGAGVLFLSFWCRCPFLCQLVTDLPNGNFSLQNFSNVLILHTYPV